MIKMNKKLILSMAALLMLSTATAALAVPGPFGYDLEKDINRNSNKEETPAAPAPQQPQQNQQSSFQTSSPFPQRQAFTADLQAPITSNVIQVNPNLYSNPTLASAKAKYKNGNYTGSLQELFALVKKEPENAFAYYYMAMGFANLGDTDAANNAYERALLLSKDDILTELANKGRDCLIGGPSCMEAPTVDLGGISDPLDEFINAPYGNGFSPELNAEIRKKELENIQNTINRKPELSPDDIDRIKKYDNPAPDSSSSIITGEKLALADDKQPTNDDIVSALNTLKRAGMTVSIQPSAPMGYQNPQMAEMSMMLGNQNSTNNDMMNMVPYMMAQSAQNGEKVNPQVIQSMMMNSMLNNLDFNSTDNK